VHPRMAIVRWPVRPRRVAVCSRVISCIEGLICAELSRIKTGRLAAWCDGKNPKACARSGHGWRFLEETGHALRPLIGPALSQAASKDRHVAGICGDSKDRYVAGVVGQESTGQTASQQFPRGFKPGSLTVRSGLGAAAGSIRGLVSGS
jgi:hypothetical protein